MSNRLAPASSMLFNVSACPFFAISSTVALPATTSCTVDRIVDQSSNTVNGTFSFMQKVIKSALASEKKNHVKESDWGLPYHGLSWRTEGPSPLLLRDLILHHQRRT